MNHSKGMKQHLIIRADANTRMGTGHVMRCLALAQAWQDRFEYVTFAYTVMPDTIKKRLDQEHMKYVRIQAPAGTQADAQQLIEQALSIHATWVVVDGYKFDAAYQKMLEEAGLKVLFMDDYGHAAPYRADLILNQNASAQPSWYTQRADGSRLLLGTEYVLLRREFNLLDHVPNEPASIARKILITMGGADPDNVTAKVLSCFEYLPAGLFELAVVLGAANPHHHALEQLASQIPSTVQFHRNITDMPAIMRQADMAITAAGSTCYELAYMAVPMLAIILAENQRALCESLDQAGIAISMGWHHQLQVCQLADSIKKLAEDALLRSTLAQTAKKRVDGQGPLRTMHAMGAGYLRLRPATVDDCRLLWEWRHDPVVLASSFCSDPIPYDQHMQWFNHKLQQPSCRIEIAVNQQQQPIGQVRLELIQNRAQISVNTAPTLRGQGLGCQLIRMASRKALLTGWAKAIDAYIKVQNVASCRAFERAGFTDAGQCMMEKMQTKHYVFTL